MPRIPCGLPMILALEADATYNDVYKSISSKFACWNVPAGSTSAEVGDELNRFALLVVNLKLGGCGLCELGQLCKV